jgi:hypothetical protein
MSITRIVVAHRPALLRRAKRVFVVGGRKLTAVSGPASEPLTPAIVASSSEAAALLPSAAPT